MLDIGTKIDNDSTSAGELTAVEFNSLATEVENIIKPFQALDGAKSNQALQVIDIMSKATSYTDVGTVNTIQLTRSATTQTIETLFDGMTVFFVPANINTGASTLKIGTLTAKPLFFKGSALEAGILNSSSRYEAIYNLANDRFDLEISSNIISEQTTIVEITANSDYTLNLMQNAHKRVIVRDAGAVLTVPRNIIVNTSVREFIAKNETAQTLIFKTSAGAGVTLLAGQEKRLYRDGTNVITIAAGAGSGLDADTVDGVQGSLLGIGGSGYTWVDETANRAVGITYSNTANKPIEIIITLTSTGTNNLHKFNIDGKSFLAGSGSADSADIYVSIALIIPSGSTYSTISASANTTQVIYSWLELK